MTQAVTISVDTLAMERYFRDLKAGLGVTIEDVIRAETGTILKECVIRTKIAALPAISRRARALGNRQARKEAYGGGSKRVMRGQMWRVSGVRQEQTQGRIWFRINTGAPKFLLLYGNGGQNIWGAGRPKTLRGRKGIRIAGTRSQIPSKSLMNRAQWFDMVSKNAIQQQTKAGKGARGLARQSWVQIADSAGILLESVRGGANAAAAIAKARRAIASDGARYQNGTAMMIGSAFKKVMRVRNTYPFGRALKMDSTLKSVIAGRIGYAQRVFKKGVMTKASDIAKAYPNLRVTIPA